MFIYVQKETYVASAKELYVPDHFCDVSSVCSFIKRYFINRSRGTTNAKYLNDLAIF